MSRQVLSGWGNYPKVQSDLRAAIRPEALPKLLDPSEGTIARGLGRSYGDAAVGGRVLDLTGLDRILSFDEATGVVVCEAGLSLGALIDALAPRGFFPMITPGTKFVTVGGCIANDVHGKAHHVDGCFSECVEWLDLLTASGEVLRCSRNENSDVFWATFGGMGLTGIVLRASIRLRRVESTFFRQRSIAVRNLDELLDAFDEHDAKYPYSVAWIDPLASGASLGRGVLKVGDHATRTELPKRLAREPLFVSKPSPITVPVNLPNFALNPVTLRVLNVAIGQVQTRGALFEHYDAFFYPLDIINEWNRGYGARGFTQYQFVVPLTDGRRNMRALLERIAASGHLPFLNVLKKFGKANQGHLSFPFEGYTFAIDFPIARGLEAFLADLDERVIDAGGRIYLGKDAFVHPDALERMYPRLAEWRGIKARIDPHDVFRSHLSKRVGLTGAH
jgi:decaprenylphospho-beta-D-ribofuranose 2-oxidase